MRKYRIDWINHIIGFLSALLGIFIAFRLESYREWSNQKEKIALAKEALKKEIDGNLAIYEKNIKELSGWLEYVDFFDKKRDDKLGGLAIGKNELAFMLNKHPGRFNALYEIKPINDTLSLYSMNQLVIDVGVTTGISTSNWKAAVASGVVSFMDYSFTNKISKIYEWIEKDIGTSQKQLYENMLGLNNNSTNWQQVRTDYINITKVYEFKRDVITEVYKDINWH